jgi:hypothetical protein
MEVVIDYEFFIGVGNDPFVKWISTAA